MPNAIYLYRLARYLYVKKVPFLPKLLKLAIFLLYNCSIPYEADIGSGTAFGYGGIGVVLHKRCVIGRHCVISQQVTIGGRSKHPEVPIIGDHVYIGAGAKVLGPIRVGHHAQIGANAVVLQDVPDRAVVAGVPARIIKYID